MFTVFGHFPLFVCFRSVSFEAHSQNRSVHRDFSDYKSDSRKYGANKSFTNKYVPSKPEKNTKNSIGLDDDDFEDEE